MDSSRFEVQYDSEAERDWATFGAALLETEFSGLKIVVTYYHPVTLHIPGGKYTPDFLHKTVDGEDIFVEIKGSKRQKNYRDARSKLRAAAEVHPWAIFYEAMHTENHGFTLERING